MAKIRFKGIDEYMQKLEQLSLKTTGSMKAAVWEGAHVVRGAMLSAIESIPVQDEYVPKDKMRTGITSMQKAGVLDGFGIAKMRIDSSVNTKLGFHGRNADGQSNASIMRQVESGTSWMQKNPVIRRAVNASKGAAEQAIKTKLDAEINRLMNGG